MKNFTDASVEYYKNKANKGLLDLNISFIEDIAMMPFSKLRTEFTKNPDKYVVKMLNVDNVLCMSEINGAQRYPIGKLEIDYYTINLIQMIERDEKIIPPEIVYIKKGLWKIYDGQHRISLIRFMDIKFAPFLIRRENLKFLEELL